ncbi:MAG: putative viral replication protein [Cressdnaviricota sp.]|nr:MAG: putative viral replication protein [Cressdnaviricota sp.]
MSSSNSSSTKREGNTKPPSKKQISCAKNWCFTLNNYTEEQKKYISSIVPWICDSAIVGLELGEGGTPHLQGFMEFKKKCRPKTHFEVIPEIHWEKCKGNKRSNVEYCEKEGDVFIRHNVPEYTVRVHECEREWQTTILTQIQERADDRTIHWIWSEAGGTRKTSMCKYLAVRHNAIITGGKAADVRNCICDYKKTNGVTPELLVINIPRSFDPAYVSYEAFENIKDMCFYSGKYEGGMVVGNSPHLYIFANFAPSTSKMSEDRWDIVNIDEATDINKRPRLF